MEPQTIRVAVGIDCDPDRNTYPTRLTFEGIRALALLEEFPDVRWTLNVRADTQIRDRCGSAAFCLDAFQDVWGPLVARGSEIAWHLHYFNRFGQQDTSRENIDENIAVGASVFGAPPRVVHMGWTFQNAYSLSRLAAVGVEIDYSPVPRMVHRGRRGVDAYDWSDFAYRPQRRFGVRMLPAYSFSNRILARRFGTERVMLTLTTHPILYRLLLQDFFRTGSDFFITYIHADELLSAVGGWRQRLYSLANLRSNLRTMQLMAERAGYTLRFTTISEMADFLFDEGHPRNAE